MSKRRYNHPINRYDKLGKYIDTFDNQLDASRKLNLPISSVNQGVKGVRKTIKGNLFRYVSEEHPIGVDLPEFRQTNRPMLVSLDNMLVVKTFNNVAEVCKVLNIKSKIDVYKKCTNNIICKKDYFFVWETNTPRKIISEKYYKMLRHSRRIRMLKRGKTIRIFNSITQVAEYLDCSRTKVIKILKDPKNSYGLMRECDYALTIKHKLIS